MCNSRGRRNATSATVILFSFSFHRDVTLLNICSYPRQQNKNQLRCQRNGTTYLAGEDPLEILKRVSHRVVTMHASDRYLKEGTLDDLRKEESGAAGYAKRLSHGEIGKGLNDYDAIFAELKRVGFNGWISVEDGVDGFHQLERSVSFLREKMKYYWPL